MLTTISRCERCGERGEVLQVHYKDRDFFFCESCEPRLEDFGAQFLREEHYANRGGFIYGAPWWRFNKLTPEDEVWERATFGEDALRSPEEGSGGAGILGGPIGPPEGGEGL